jgi:hypothetical protein
VLFSQVRAQVREQNGGGNGTVHTVATGYWPRVTVVFRVGNMNVHILMTIDIALHHMLVSIKEQRNMWQIYDV